MAQGSVYVSDGFRSVAAKIAVSFLEELPRVLQSSGRVSKTSLRQQPALEFDKLANVVGLMADRQNSLS